MLEWSVLADLMERQRELERSVELFLEEHAILLSDSELIGSSWLEYLYDQGRLRGFVLLHRSETIRMGEEFASELAGDDGFFVDKRGKLHYRYTDPQELVFMDALIATDSLELGEGVAGAVLYDVRSGESQSLKGGRQTREALELFFSDGASSDGVSSNGSSSNGANASEERADSIENWKLSDEAEALIIGPNRVVVRNMVEGDLQLFSVFPILFGFHSLYFIGLIILGSLTILVLYLSVQYGLAGAFVQKGEDLSGGTFMGEKEEEKSPIIEEIDREISDLVDEEQPVLAKQTGKTESLKTGEKDTAGGDGRGETSTETSKSAGVEQEDQRPRTQDRRAQKLLEDGIVIKK
jgi:hypothetical protein